MLSEFGVKLVRTEAVLKLMKGAGWGEESVRRESVWEMDDAIVSLRYSYRHSAVT